MLTQLLHILLAIDKSVALKRNLRRTPLAGLIGVLDMAIFLPEDVSRGEGPSMAQPGLPEGVTGVF